MKKRPTHVLAVLVPALLAAALTTGPVSADPLVCVTYDFAGSELCVSENGVEGAGRHIPGEPVRVCVIYTFSGAQICVSSDGEIEQQ